MFGKALWNLFSRPPAANPPAPQAVSRLRWGSVSITGNYRENNEDRYFVQEQGRYFLVADGMGGQSAGEKASELAAEVLPQQLDRLVNFQADDPQQIPQAIEQAVHRANAEILSLSEINPAFHSMGTTVAMIVVVGPSMYVVGIGDSRVYRLRNDQLEQLTVDDSLTEHLRRGGMITKEQAATHRYRHVLVRYRGSKEGGAPTNPARILPQPGDRFVICSDGVTDGLSDDALANLLKQGSDPQSAAQAIVDAALAGGSRDNITCVTVFVE